MKKGKKGKKFLKDKGHKNTGFKTVYHKEEYGVSKKVSWRKQSLSNVSLREPVTNSIQYANNSGTTLREKRNGTRRRRNGKRSGRKRRARSTRATT